MYFTLFCCLRAVSARPETSETITRSLSTFVLSLPPTQPANCDDAMDFFSSSDSTGGSVEAVDEDGPWHEADPMFYELHDDAMDF